MAYTEKTVEERIVFQGKVFTARNDIAELHNGDKVTREVAQHNGGVGIIAVDGGLNVYAVRQYRYAIGREILEIPAGKLEKSEDHFDCAVRELGEETGLTAGKWTYLGVIYPSPGFSTEIIHLYLATDLSHGASHPDDDEFLEIVKLPFSELHKMAVNAEICDAKTVAALFRAERFLTKSGQLRNSGL